MGLSPSDTITTNGNYRASIRQSRLVCTLLLSLIVFATFPVAADDVLRTAGIDGGFVVVIGCDDPDLAMAISKNINTINIERRDVDTSITRQAVEMIQRDKLLQEQKSTVLYNPEWHKGVIGIVASRLVSRYGVPSILISIENDTGFGSARSVPGIPVYSILSDIQDEHRILESLGGHPMAAGFRIPRENIPILRQEMNRILSEEEWKRHLGSVLYIDGKLEEQDYNSETVRILKNLEPFGEGNRKPVFHPGVFVGTDAGI